MKTFNEYWAWLCCTNPELKDDTRMTISTRAFKQAVRNAFDRGVESTQATAAPMSGLAKVLDVFFNRRKA